MSDKQQVSEEDLHSAIIADSSNSEERKSLLTPLEIEMCTKFYNRVFITFLSAPLIYTPIHIFLKRSGIKKSLYIPFAAGVSFLSTTLLSMKFTYDYMGECLALPPSEYYSSAELHFLLKKYGLVYVHQDGKKKYSILPKPDLSAQPPPPMPSENGQQHSQHHEFEQNNNNSLPKE